MSASNDQPGELVINVFGFLLTQFCVARCGHCGSDSGPEVRGVADPAHWGPCLDALPSLGIEQITVSGGEPIAVRTALHAFMERAQQNNIDVHVCSNGYWATDSSRADRVLGELVDRGLTHLLLSTDSFHLPYVTVGQVVEAAASARRAGVTCQIAVPSLRGDLRTHHIIEQLQRETQALVFTHPVHPVGRGAELPRHLLGIPAPSLTGCHLVGNIEVHVTGAVSVCPTSADFSASGPLRLGHLADDDVTTILSRFHATPWHRIIAERGPLGLDLLLRTGLDRPTRTPGFHPCELCRDLHDMPHAVEAFRSRTGIDLLAPASADALGDLFARIDFEAANYRPAEDTAVAARSAGTRPADTRPAEVDRGTPVAIGASRS